MKGIILAGGEGKRLRPLALGVPKPLVAIKGKPLINYNLELFAKHGVRDVKVLIRPVDMGAYERWHAEHKSAFPDIKLELIVEPEPMGTFGYLFHNFRDLAGNEDIFVTNGDDIKDIDLGKMLGFHRRAGVPAVIALMKMEKPDDYGAVLTSGDRVRSFLEKQKNMPEGLVSAGMYIIAQAAIEHIAAGISKEKRFLMFEKDLFPILAQNNLLGAFVCEGGFLDCGTPERLEKARQETQSS